MPDRTEIALWSLAFALSLYTLVKVLDLFGSPHLAGAGYPTPCTVRPGRPS